MITRKSFHREQVPFFSSELFFHCLSMQRFVSKRSSSSVDLTSSSLDDVRAERAAIALSLVLSRPPDRHAKSFGRPSTQQLWERSLQEHILHHHEFPHGVRLQRPGWWRPRDTIARPLTHTRRSPTSALPVPHPTAAAFPVAAPSKDEPSDSTAKRRKVHVDPHRARLVLRHVPPVEDRAVMGHAALLG